jgi:hypothetical protein
MAKRGTGGQKPDATTPGKTPPKADEVFKNDRQQDDASVRAKNTGHKKKTADKWNQ